MKLGLWLSKFSLGISFIALCAAPGGTALAAKTAITAPNPYCNSPLPAPTTDPTLPSNQLSTTFEFWIGLVLNQGCYYPGDQFVLDLVVSSPTTIGTGSLTADVYILLLVYDQYYCYPGWPDGPCGETMTFGPGVTVTTILDFTWPSAAGNSLEPLCFFGALFMPGTLDVSNIIGNISSVCFEYREP